MKEEWGIFLSRVSFFQYFNVSWTNLWFFPSKYSESRVLEYRNDELKRVFTRRRVLLPVLLYTAKGSKEGKMRIICSFYQPTKVYRKRDGRRGRVELPASVCMSSEYAQASSCTSVSTIIIIPCVFTYVEYRYADILANSTTERESTTPDCILRGDTRSYMSGVDGALPPRSSNPKYGTGEGCFLNIYSN